ncbi:MAG: penicillin-binding protein activator [Pseudomonadales bacterium]|nr:penicillin-binding protein activator [Pseudomonadales bacterium]
MTRLIILFLTCFVIISCGTTPRIKPNDNQPVQEAPHSTSLSRILERITAANSPADIPGLRIEAAMLLIEEQRYDEANQQLAQVEFGAASGNEQSRYILLGLKLAVATENATLARSILELDKDQLFAQRPLSERHEVNQLRIQALELTGQFLRAAQYQSQTAGMLNEQQYWINHEQLWNNLRKVDIEELEQTTAPAQIDSNEWQGWVDLARTLKQSPYSLDQQIESISLWQNRWANHPAAQKLPEELELLQAAELNRPSKIVLALPLSGPLAAAGQAVREGFMAAYYEDQVRKPHNTEIIIHDTAREESFIDQYLSISAQGPDLIIGPLKKSSVEALARMNALPTPTLALNYIGPISPAADSDGPPSAQDSTETAQLDQPAQTQPIYQSPFTPLNLYQFGLAIEDEISQTLDLIAKQGKQNIVALCPDTTWGWRSCEDIEKNWNARNGRIIEKTFFDPNQENTKLIESLFKVDESKARYRALRQVIGWDLENTARRRADIDAIVLISKPQHARRLNPLFAFFYAGDIPVYSTSSINDGNINPNKDSDLNGIIFTETPWSLYNSPIKQQMHELLPDLSNRFDRLFALGADAYLLAPRLTVMQRFPDSKVSGYTGQLKITSDLIIQRSLNWAMFRNGKVQEAKLQ